MKSQAATGEHLAESLDEYPEYRDSRVEWLGRVPSHWICAPVYARCEVQLGKMLDEKKITGRRLAPYLRNVDVQWDMINVQSLPMMDFTATDRERFRLRKGDLLVCEGGEVGRAAIWSGELEECYYQKALHRVRMRANGDVPRYMFYALQTAASLRVFVAEGNPNTFDHLTGEKLRRHRFPFPPAEEQRAIVGFLDERVAEIDQLISDKNRLVNLLQEQLSTLISRAVTRGLDPSVPMRDSGVEWLGDIPEHWARAPLYAKCEVQLGKMLDEKRITGKHLAPYLRNVDVQWGKINVTSLPTMDFTERDRKKFSLQQGDLLVCEGGEVGRAAIWSGELDECYYQKALHRVRFRQTMDIPKYLYYVFMAAANVGVFVAEGNPNTIDHLTAEKLRRHRFPFPPPNEQHKIVEALDEQDAKIGVLVSDVKSAIEKLKEYRNAYISDAVTGKIDVRSRQRPAVA